MQHLPILKICSCPCQAGPNGLHGFFQLWTFHLVEYQRQQNRERERHYKVIQAQPYRISQQPPEIIGIKETVQVLHSRPRAAPDAQPGRVVLEGDLHAVHRQITKNNEIDDRRDQKQVKALALVELCEHPPAPLPAARPLFGACPCRCGRPAALQHFNHFFHRPSFGFVFIVQPKTRFCHVQKLTSAAIFAKIHP